MKETFICCWRLSKWTKFIAWVHIILNTTLIIMMLTFLPVLIPGGITLPDEVVTKVFPGRSASETFSILLLCTGVVLLVSVVGLAMAVILLKGTQEENVEYLQAWQLFATFELTVIAISILILLSNVKRCSEFGTIVSRAGIILAAQGFSIWIVRAHKRETLLNIKKRNIQLQVI